ncbi:hypothetical protein B0H13DRAFT_1885370 [Mycena leptocephala]|nr:hypothetical protein B0H13DRAFT_1885370 [Mycena leptocephala]
MSTSSNEISLILLRHLQPLLPPTNNPRMFRYLDSLWISHVCSLAQVIHDCTFGRDVAQIPIDMMKQLRVGVQTAVSNMAHHPSLRIATHQDTDPSAVSEYYVPFFTTLTFFMMEWFVNLIGFDGDEDMSMRESVFAALDTLQHVMIVRSDYYCVPLDVPGFTFDSVDPYDYGVGHHTKDLQIHEVTSSGRLAHQFGTALPRYEPDLGPAGYRFPSTHDFQFLDFLPSYLLTEHRKLCLWVEVLLWHLASQVLFDSVRKHRRLSLARNKIAWAAVDVTVPGEAFHMLQLVSFLCHFVGYTNGDDTIESLCPTILLPLIGASSYPEYDRNGRLQYADLLRSPCPLPFLFGGQVPMSNPSLQVLTAPMGVTVPVTPTSNIFSVRILLGRGGFLKHLLVQVAALLSDSSVDLRSFVDIFDTPERFWHAHVFLNRNAGANHHVFFVYGCHRTPNIRYILASVPTFSAPPPVVVTPAKPFCSPVSYSPHSKNAASSWEQVLFCLDHSLTPVPKSILKKKYSREVTLYAPDVEVIVVPDSSDEQEEEDDEDDKMNDEENQLDAPSSPSVPVTHKKPKVVASAPSSSSSSAVAIPRSFRQRLSSSCLVAVPGPPPEITVGQLEDDKAALEWSMDKLAVCLQILEDPSWQPLPVDPVPPFILPTAALPINYSGEPVVPVRIDVEIPLEIPPLAPIAEQRACLLEIEP